MSDGKPFLRWAGSKKRLIPVLRPYWSDGFVRYVEPFMGSAALFFAIEPPRAILSDINSELVGTFCAVRDHPRAVHNRLQHLPLGRDAYYRIRHEDPRQLSPIDQAARFVYLNRFCFNGLYRTNTNGKFNVPYGASRTGTLPTEADLCKSAKLLSRADLRTGDFEDTLKDVQPSDFVYIDPPYAVSNRRIFRQYGPDSFGTEDLARLASALTDIDHRGAVFLVSYAMCSEALKVFKGWQIRRTYTQRSVSGFSRHRRTAMELLISNRRLTSKGVDS